MSDNLTQLQRDIINLLSKNKDTLEVDLSMSCDDIAWELNRHKMHIGNSVKALVKKGILDSYKQCEESNPKYFLIDV